jgi:superoxide dismutase
MTLHHKKHHQTYVNALNAAEESLAKARTPVDLITLQPAIKFNGGGEHINQSFSLLHTQLIVILPPRAYQPFPLLEELGPRVFWGRQTA